MPALVAIGGLVAAAGTAGALTAVRGSDDPNSSSSAVAGGSMLVKGTGCQAGGTVTFVLDGSKVPETSTASRAGIFVQAVRIPADSAVGIHAVDATCDGSDGKPLTRRTRFNVSKPELPMGPSFWAGSASQGGVAMVKGSGCKAGSKVTFALDGKPLPETVTANSDGTFGGPGLRHISTSASLGEHKVTATCVDVRGKPLVQRAALNVIKPAPDNPREKPAPEVIRPLLGSGRTDTTPTRAGLIATTCSFLIRVLPPPTTRKQLPDLQPGGRAFRGGDCGARSGSKAFPRKVAWWLARFGRRGLSLV